MFRLRCCSQKYDWGKVGPASMVYQLQAVSHNSEELEKDGRYAEMWMGTHPSGCSKLWHMPEKDLSVYIQENPAVLGKFSRRRFGDVLPFLFKVLSIDKALSIQAHPNKHYALRCHMEQPEIYKDANHKPEMAIALTRFEALLGFRPLKQILAFYKGIPELQCLLKVKLPKDEIDDQEAFIKELYSKLLLCPQEKITAAAACLTARLKLTTPRDLILEGIFNCDEFDVPVTNHERDPFTEKPYIVKLFLQLNSEFPGDVGCFSLFFLNLLRLEPGEAIFLEANILHAYLSGECMECMANSDNVVRAGLTPKFKDVKRLLEILKFTTISPEKIRFPSFFHDAVPAGVSIETFKPPVSEFAVDSIKLHNGNEGLSLYPVRSASILIFIQGVGVITVTQPEDPQTKEINYGPGFVFFVPADELVCMISNSQNPVHVFRAFVNQ